MVYPGSGIFPGSDLFPGSTDDVISPSIVIKSRYLGVAKQGAVGPPTFSALTSEVRKAYLASKLRVTRRLAIYEADGTTLWLPLNFMDRLVSGSIAVEFDRDERRSLDGVVLQNKDGMLNIDSDGGFYYDKIIKVYRGLEYRNSSGVLRRFETQVGEFMIDNISEDRFPRSISLSGRDYTKKLLLDKFGVDTAFSSGRRVDEIVQVVATNGGIKKFRLGVPGLTVASTVTFARNSSRWESIKDMCSGLGVEIYFDREGYLVTRMFDDVSKTPPSFELSQEEGKENIIDFSRTTSDSNIFNHVVVTGTSEEETVTGYRFIASLENRDLTSPTCVQKIGRRTFPFEVSYLTSQSQTNDLARRLLKVKQLEDYQLTFSTVCLPWLEAGRVIGFQDPKASDTIPTRFLFSGFGIPLELGPMSGTGKRIVMAGVPEEDQEEVSLDSG